MHAAFPTEHSTHARRVEKKNREKETKSYFYGKLRSDCGAISQVHLNKSIKAYPNMKKMLRPSLQLYFFYLPLIFGSQNCSQTVYLKQTEHRLKKKNTHWSNLPSFSINYVLNVLVENGSQHAACSELVEQSLKMDHSHTTTLSF